MEIVMTKICFMGANEATIKYSITQFLQLFSANGVEYTISLNPKNIHFKYLNFKGGRFLNNMMFNYSRLALFRILDLFRLKQYDIVFMHQYFYHPMRSPILELMVRFLSKKFVFYYFDPIWNNAQTTDQANRKKLARIIKASDHVIVANEYLADYASQFSHNVSVLPMTVDMSEYCPSNNRNNDKLVVGFCGAPYNYIYLKELIPVFKYFQEKDYKVEFRVVSGGALPDYLEGLGIQYVKWSPDNEITELQKIDVGIVPLADDDWTRGKFSIKLIEHMAVRSPVICSNVGVNPQVIQNGYNGYVVNNCDEWIEKIILLSENEEIFKRVAENAYVEAIKKYSHTENAKKYIEIFRNLMNDK